MSASYNIVLYPSKSLIYRLIMLPSDVDHRAGEPAQVLPLSTSVGRRGPVLEEVLHDPQGS